MTAGVTAIIAAGCGGESPTATLAPAAQPTTAPAPTATAAPTKAPATVAAATATVAPTQAPTVAPTAVTATQSGTLRVAVGSISPPVFLPSKLKWPTNLDKIAWGVADPITYHGIAAPKLGGVDAKALGESWTVAPDGTSVTFKIRKGVQFHEGWGELTAKDVVYTFDEAFKEGTLAKIAEEGLWMSKWVLVDDFTVTMTAKQGQKIPPLWARILSNNSQLGGIWSKAV
ncbi:MAG: hypothetical protein HY678_10375, partial [Chloroflexi bacterium]|nr:hypothetical protein [Chloroflexota bacterium]